MIPKEKPQIETPDFSKPNIYSETQERKFRLKINLKDFIRFLKNKFVFPIVILGLVLIILIWILWLIKMIEFGQIYSPLFTNRFLGNIANYSLPIFGTIIFFINLYLAEKSFNKEKLAAYFLLGSALFVQVLTLILIRFYLHTGF